MGEPFLAEIKIVSFNFAPRGWAVCDGQLLPINQNQALFSLLGTTYGGNGQTNFALPDLRGRVPIHVNPLHPLGQTGGEQAHTLNINEMPPHSHAASGVTSDADAKSPDGSLHGYASVESYSASGPIVSFQAQLATNAVGGSQPHQNLQPFLTLVFVIALQGIFPSQN